VPAEPGLFDAQVSRSGPGFDTGNSPEVVNHAHMETARTMDENGRTGPEHEVRLFGVEEEMLLVSADTGEPLAVAENAVSGHERRQTEVGQPDGFAVTLEVQQEQIEIVCPPQESLAEQIATIRHGRSLAQSAARDAGALAVALATSPFPVRPHLVSTPRFRKMHERFALMLQEQLTCGFHVHVAVESPDEGIAVLNRIRIWLPVILALTSNSPFWNGIDTGYNSYRYQVWCRWPASGPSEIFDGPDAYDRQVQALLETGVLLDEGMVYFDARLSTRFPTIEVRIADVCLDPTHAAVLAAAIRALVETASREWRSGIEPPVVSVLQLRTWSWQASRSGVCGMLVNPLTGRPSPAGDVVAGLLSHIDQVLVEWQESALVERVITSILRNGSGAERQRESYMKTKELASVVLEAAEWTHNEQLRQ